MSLILMHVILCNAHFSMPFKYSIHDMLWKSMKSTCHMHHDMIPFNKIRKKLRMISQLYDWPYVMGRGTSQGSKHGPPHICHDVFKWHRPNSVSINVFFISACFTTCYDRLYGAIDPIVLTTCYVMYAMMVSLYVMICMWWHRPKHVMICYAVPQTQVWFTICHVMLHVVNNN